MHLAQNYLDSMFRILSHLQDTKHFNFIFILHQRRGKRSPGSRSCIYGWFQKSSRSSFLCTLLLNRIKDFHHAKHLLYHFTKFVDQCCDLLVAQLLFFLLEEIYAFKKAIFICALDLSLSLFFQKTACQPTKIMKFISILCTFAWYRIIISSSFLFCNKLKLSIWNR